MKNKLYLSDKRAPNGFQSQEYHKWDGAYSESSFPPHNVSQVSLGSLSTLIKPINWMSSWDSKS